MRVAVQGVGYVGTITAACLADFGHEVTGIDPDLIKVQAVASGRSPVVEPQLDSLVRRTVASGHLRATSDVQAGLADAEVVIVCVGTPAKSTGAVDLHYLERAAIEIGERLARNNSYLAIVIRSTVPPGTVDEMFRPTVAAVAGAAAAESFGVAVCPEFLREGSGVADFYEPPSPS
jgi:GDP-mannose 6-dehydrogenase